ncbi:MAG: oxidoreductase [Pseudomonadota bacterium]|nr:oxidoreductase [Pseudomonadota bacterium]
MAWTLDNLPDLSDRTLVITGANSGLGWETTRMLAVRGARVVMACRNQEKAREAMGRIQALLPTARLELATLDLGSLRSIRACAKDLKARFPAIDVLVNNAGIMAIPRALTEDGFEVQIGTNHLGHFALTGLLFDALQRGRAPRVVNVSSLVHTMGTLRFDDLMGERSYQKWMAYAQSKLANLLFTYELQRRLEARGVGMVSAAAHPGYSSTNLAAVGPQQEKSAFGAAFMSMGDTMFAQSAERGALPSLYAAAAPDVASGDYYGPDGLFEVWGRGPKKVSGNAASRDPVTGAKLWEVSEALTSVSWLS